MSKIIKSLSIGQFRGIKSLVVNDLNDVNVIVGDNNSGKTTLLEAIYLLRSPHSLNNVFRAARLREASAYSSASSYDSFVNIFPRDSEERNIYLQAEGIFGNASVEIKGEEGVALADENDLMGFPPSLRPIKAKALLGSEIPCFSGTMKTAFNSVHREEPVRVTDYSRGSLNTPRSNEINIEYLSPISHITNNTFDDILKNDQYRFICIELIRLFDPDIEDLLYMRSNNGHAVEYIKSKRLGVTPLSTYGDGIKKILSLANGVIAARGGALLIDEIDTSIHYKYYNDIFSFLIKAAALFNVQLFITTHSDEAILELLKTQGYSLEYPPAEDKISILTFRKNEYGDIRSRAMKGYDVFTNQELFDFEVRI